MCGILRIIVCVSIIQTAAYAANDSLDESGLQSDDGVSNLAFMIQLYDRIAVLEARDRNQQEQIDVMKAQGSEQQTRIETMGTEMTELKKQCVHVQTVISAQKKQIVDMKTGLSDQRKLTALMRSTIEKQGRKLRMLLQVSSKSKGKGDATNNNRKNTYHIAEEKAANNNRIKRAENEVTVAFYANAQHDDNNLGVNQPVIFENIVINIGNAYNAHHGLFIAPVAGIYVFTTSIHSKYDMRCHFSVNAINIGNFYIHGSAGDQSSQTVIVQLKQGDDVAVLTNTVGAVYGSGYSTFSGFLLKQDYLVVVVG